MVVAMILGAMPMSVLAADAAEPALTGTKLTTAHAGQTLAAGEYYVEPGATLTLRGGTGKSGLTVAENSTVTINVPAGSTLNVYGGAASGTTGAGAGIEVSSTSNLKIIGSGTLNATGGKAANGSNGSNGETARWGDDDYSYIPDSGYGGAGGGGAGAGIGTKGGNGGSNTSWQIAMSGSYYRTVWTDYFMDNNYSGSNGHKGNDGASASACGGIFVQPSVTVNAVGGAAGTKGGSGGSAGSRDYESDDHDIRGLAGGAGGGGGGAGKKGADIGTGGGGGGGGGAGGGIGYAWSCWFVGGGGGGGGAGAVGGSGGAWSSDSAIPDHDCGKYDGGKETSSLSGSTGGVSSGGTGGSGAKVKIRSSKSTSASWQWPHGGNGGKGGNAGSNCTEQDAQTLYTVTIDDGVNTTVYYASADKFLPETLAVQSQTGYTFEGYYDGSDTQYYDASGNRTSAAITSDITIFAKLDVNEYDYTINRDPNSSGSSGEETQGSVAYGSSITLTTPNRDGYLFRGWKISASSGNLNQNAYYTYSTVAPVMMRMMMRSSTQSSNQSFVRDGSSFLTAGVEKIGSSVTLYNLSADDGANLTIEEVWRKDYFEVTFKNFDGAVIGEQNGPFVTMISAPTIPDNTSEYYTYTFKYWKCNIDGNYYTTEQLNALNMGAFLSYESELGEQVYTGITFTAVYDIEYKKELHFVGSLGNGNLDMSDTENFPNGVLILGEGQANVPVITNFKITKNDGVAALLLIPQYDASVFNIKAISINGQLVYGNGATSSTVLNGFNVTITGTETESDMLKILLDNLTPDATVSDDIFVQIVYEMKEAVGGRYEFGFITADYDSVDTDHITHGDRSEAYGTYDPNVNTDTDAWRFNELKITVDTTAINVVVRVNGKIEIDEEQSFIYNGQQMSAADVTEQILNALQYSYNGFAQKEDDTLTIKWYDAQGNELSEAPKNVGTYQIGISAAQTTYYFEAAEVRATFTITPYEIFVVAGDQTFEYTGNNIVINGAASQGGIYIKDADGNYIPVDEFVNSELTFSGVMIEDNYVNVGEYLNAIAGILTGDQSNYTVNYVNGTLTITKAVNDWIGEITAPGGEYNGQKYDTVTFDAKFGKDTATVEYFYGYQTDADGNKTEIWKEEAPVNAGTYIVRITIQGTDNYSGLEDEITLVITKKAINVDGLTFSAIDKIYNGDSQYWSINPDGDNTTDDAEVWLTASDVSLLQNIIFAGMKHPTECFNVGTYEILAVLQISNPNYTFIETYVEVENGEEVTKTREVDEYELPVEVRILPRTIIVDVHNQSAPYSGEEPAVQQGQSYVTITLEDGSAAPDYIISDFFGGVRDLYMPAIEYSPSAVYYKLVDNDYVEIYLAEDEFNANKALAGGEGYVDYYTKITVQPETLQLLKAAGVVAGDYALSATLGSNSNYTIVVNGGIFTITKKLIPVPELGILIYNGQNQTPAVPSGYENIYNFVGTGKDVGVYTLTAVLLDKDNYAWENVISVNVGSLPTNRNFTVKIGDRTLIIYIQDIDDYATVNFKVSGETYSYTTIPSTSDDIILPWYIDYKTLTLVYSDATQTYEYGTWGQDIIGNLGEPQWKNGDGPYAGDDRISIDDLHIAYNDSYPVVGENSLTIAQGYFNPNYKVLIEGGKVEITKKILTQEDLTGNVEAAIKYYTGNVLALDPTDDFTVTLTDYNNNSWEVFYLTDVDTKNHIDANGWMNGENFTYYVDEESGKIYVTVTVALTEEAKANYELPAEVNTTFDVEAFIAKAQNRWTSGPAIDSTNIGDIKTTATPLFGALNTPVQFYTDRDCTILATELNADTTYYAKFTVTETDNYYGIETIIVFSGDHITVIKPIVRLDSETGDVASAEVSIIYDGKVHKFVVPTSVDGKYTVILGTVGDWKDVGSYTITIQLAENCAWNDGTVRDLTYTLKINKKNLTITAENKDITYKDAAPEYTATANGLVDGETLAGLLGADWLDYIDCTYAQLDNAGVYDISIDELVKDILTNYNVTLNDGTLTVKKLVFDYDDINVPQNDPVIPNGGTILDFITDGRLDFVYNNTEKNINTEAPDELIVTIVYKDASGNVLLGAPKDAGTYTAIVTVTLQDGYNADNYILPVAGEFTIVIDRAKITITVHNQSYVYDGTNRYDQFNADVENGFDAYYTVIFGNVSAFNDGSTVTSIVLTEGEYVNAGTYFDKITAEHTYSADNYVVTIVNGDLIITKATNEWKTPLASDNDIVYDKDAVVDNTDFWSEAKFGDASVVYEFYLKQANGTYVKISAPTNAGTYYVKATVAETSNYAGLDSGYVMLVINKDTITIDAVTFLDDEVYYNGQAHYILAGNYEELFNVSYTGNGKINAGTYTVTATFTIKDTANYELEGADSKSATLTINKVLITIKADNKTSMFGDAIENLTYGIVFGGDSNYTDFYRNDWGSIVLSTTATSLSDVGTYDIVDITISNTGNYEVTFNKGTYTITKFTNNTITVEAEDVRYLMDLIYSAEALRGQSTIKFTFATSEDGEYTETLPKDVGTYYVKATIADTDNYNGVEAIGSFKIEKATLSAITGITYNKDTATWTAVITTTDGKTIDCTVSYLVGAQSLTTAEFKATSAGNFSVIAVPSDTNNYNNSAEVDLAPVYSVEFADKVANHERQTNLADLTVPAFATQYRFEGQAVTRPDAIPTVEGYTFREWMLENSDYNFASAVNGNITLYAAWTINTYTIDFYNEVVTDSKIENGIFVEGEISTVLFSSKTFEYGDTIVFIDSTPTKADDAIYTYTFAYWADAIRGNEIASGYVVTDNDSFYAVYGFTAREFTVTYMVSVDGGKYFVHQTVTAPYGTQLISLDNVNWFIGDVWYTDEGRSTSAPTFVLARDTTLYGAYVFDIGAGDVNADGEIDVDDITLYRRWIVGGYNIVSVAPGSEWDLVNSDSFDTNTLYFVERVNDANRDDSGDIRDITTVRMALTGGYGYTYVSGLDSLAGVSGEGIVIESQGLISVDTTESFKAALEKGGIIQLTANIALDDTVTISNDTVIYLNGYELDTSANSSRPFEMSSNARLVIYGANSTVKTGRYGLVNIPVGADNVDVVIHGGTYLANTNNGSFIKPRGEGAISIVLNDVNLTDTSDKNYAIDASSYYGEKLSVNVEGGTYDVWTGFAFDGPATNEFLLNNVTINCKTVGVEGGGDESFKIEKAAHVTINNCNINLTADLSVDSYSPTMGAVMAGYGAQIEVNNSTLSSNVHIASICSGDGNCVIEINDCTIVHNPVNRSYEAYEFYDEGSILFSQHVSTKEDLAAAFAVGGMITLEADIALDQALVLDNGKNVTIDLNSHILTMANVANNYAAVIKNGTLTIEGEGTVIVPGIYGFGTASNTTNGHIVINGGEFVGNNADYLFACYNGSITINSGSFTANYCVLNNFPDDGNDNIMTGTAIVNGGGFTVTGEDEEYPSSIFFGDVTVNVESLPEKEAQ